MPESQPQRCPECDRVIEPKEEVYNGGLCFQCQCRWNELTEAIYQRAFAAFA